MKNNSIRWLSIISPVKMTTYWYSMSWFWDTPSPAIILLVARYPVKSKYIYNIYLSIYIYTPIHYPLLSQKIILSHYLAIPHVPCLTFKSPAFSTWSLPFDCHLPARRLLLQQAIDQPTTQGPIASTTAAIHRSPWQRAAAGDAEFLATSLVADFTRPGQRLQKTMENHHGY